MEVGDMKQQDQIKIQDAKIVNQNYLINWLAPIHHQDILVCVKSSWVPYDDLIRILQNHCDEMIYQGLDVCWQKVRKQTSILIPTAKIKTPIDVVLLPVTNDKILVPVDENEYNKLQRTIKGVIKYIKKRESCVFSATEHLRFINDALPVSREEIVAEYVIDNLHYPVTEGMLGQTISVQIPKKYKCQPFIAKSMSGKYSLKEYEWQKEFDDK